MAIDSTDADVAERRDRGDSDDYDSNRALATDATDADVSTNQLRRVQNRDEQFDDDEQFGWADY